MKKKKSIGKKQNLSSVIVVLLMVLILLSIFNLGFAIQAYTKSWSGSSTLQQKSSSGEVSLTILPAPKEINSAGDDYNG